MAEFNLVCKNNVRVVLIDGEQAEQEFCKPDLFIDSMSDFDLHARMDIPSGQEATRAKYIESLKNYIVKWDRPAIQAIESTMIVLNTKKNLRYFKFPETLYIIITNGQDEGGAAYCRNMNLIILPMDDLFDPGCIAKDPVTNLEYNTTFTHEMFHIWSRNNNIIRDRLYEIIGYRPTPNIIDLPENMAHLKITNPDAPITHHYIELEVHDSQETKYLAPILMASGVYTTEKKNFFSYLEKRFIVLDKITLKSTGELVKYDDFIDQLYNKIGRNTKYIIHPEEIMADNFVFFVHNKPDLPNPEIMERILDVISQ